MPVQPTYPGVYVQEIPSGVRTIAGVSTSVAAFLGRASAGPLFQPVLCLSFSDFERVFTANFSDSDLARQVRLFFQNGGTQCYVVRLASGAESASVVLRNATGDDVLVASAKSEGLRGNAIRLQVSYGGQSPYKLFSLEVFQWEALPSGQLVKAGIENFGNLSMDPENPRYAPTLVSQQSALINLATAPGVSANTSYVLAGRPVAINDNTDDTFREQWRALIGTNSLDPLTGLPSNDFRIRVGYGPTVNVSLAALDFDTDPQLNTADNARNNLADAIQAIINSALPGGSSVTVSFEPGPVAAGGGINQQSVLLQIAGDGDADVHVEPAQQNDLARRLMLGAAQGGLEQGPYSNARPVPNGIYTDFGSGFSRLIDLAGQAQTAFNAITVGGTDISLGNTLQIHPDATASMYFSAGYAIAEGQPANGLRERLAIIANAVNAQRAADPNFRFTATLNGYQLSFSPTAGGDNATAAISTSGADGLDLAAAGLGLLRVNVRHYSLGDTGTGSFQAVGIPGTDGTAPGLTEYREAFMAIERQVDLFNLMILPRDADHSPETVASLWGPASVFCQEQRAFLLIDAPENWTNVQQATDPASGVNSLRLGLVRDYSAVFYPRLTIRENGLNVQTGTAGAIAGLMARIDGSRGVWKAPAGTEADIRGVVGLEYRFSDRENGVLNPQGINTLRIFPNGIVNWGARTMDGADDFASEWKYIPVRRTALYIEESLYRGLKWVVFEPNDEPLWAQIRVNVGGFMHGLFRQGAFQGVKKDDAYFVKCDSETTTQNDINLGIVNILVGFAPLKPAEFVILSLQQMAGQVQA